LGQSAVRVAKVKQGSPAFNLFCTFLVNMGYEAPDLQFADIEL
jgi:hypothetical protein